MPVQGVQTALASAAQTSTGVSGLIQPATPQASSLNLLVSITAVTGTLPTLVLSVEWSDDGTNFAVVDTTADAFASLSATTNVVKQFTRKGSVFRIRWTIGGSASPSFTFSVLELDIV